MNSLKTFFLICLVLNCFVTSIYADEVQQEIRTDKSGESIKIIYYKEEPDGLIKREYYGKAPIYRLVIEYFDNTNKKYIDRIEYYNIDYSNPQKPQGVSSDGAYFYKKGNPDDYTIAKIKVEDSIVTTDIFFVENNNANKLQEKYVATKSGKVLSIEQIFVDPQKAKKHIKSIKQIYDENQQIVEVDVFYFNNEYCRVSQKKIYLPPRYLAEKDQPYQVYTDYSNSSDGLLRSEEIHDLSNTIITTNYFDSKYTRDGFTRRVDFDFNGVLKRNTYYFDNKLFRGIVYFFNIFYNDDGSIKEAHYYDKDEKEVDPSLLEN